LISVHDKLKLLSPASSRHFFPHVSETESEIDPQRMIDWAKFRVSFQSINLCCWTFRKYI